MKRRLFISLLLSLCAFVSIHASYIESNGLLYEPSGYSVTVGQPTCRVIGFTNDYINSTVLTIPNTVIDTATSLVFWPTSIAPNAFKDSKLVTINSLGTIQEIGDYAFANTLIAGDLSSITVMTVGAHAFDNCDLLVSVNFAACTDIGDCAFKDCRNLYNAIFPMLGTIGQYAFYDCEKLLHFELPVWIQYIGRYAFAGCKDLDYVTNTAVVNLHTIPYACFQGCEDLRSFHIPSCVTRIEDYAFDGCSSMDEISIPDEVEYIGYYAFQDCRSLVQVYINGANTQLSQESPFAGCTNIKKVRLHRNENSIPFVTLFPDCKETLETVELHSGSTCIGKMAKFGQSQTEFGGYTKLSTVYIPEGVTVIGDLAFSDCKALKSITLPQSLKKIGTSAFKAAGLETLVIPDNVDTLGRGAFENCSDLLSIHWSNALTYLPWEVCMGDSALQQVDLPVSITTIGRDAFRNCVALTSVAIQGRQTSWESDYFTGCPNIKSLRIFMDEHTPQISTLLYSSRNSLEEVILQNGSTHLGTTSSNGHPYTFSTLANFGNLKRVSIPNGLKMIGRQAFDGDTLLKVINIPLTVDTIGEYAFRNTAIEKVVIPNSLTTIAEGAFNNCAELTEVGFPTGLQTIGRFAFMNCSKLTKIELPFSVTSILESAFNNCSMVTDIILGDKISTLGDRVFYQCSEVESITCYNKNVLTNISGYEYSPFYGINKSYATLYVPASSLDTYKNTWQWNSRFDDIRPIGAIDVETDGVEVFTTETTATISWPYLVDAERYFLTVLDNNNTIICEAEFDFFGELIKGAYSAPAVRQNNISSQDGYAYTVIGLSPSTDYTFEIMYIDEDDYAFASYLGTFTTPGLTGIEEIITNNQSRITNKVILNGRLCILNSGNVYDIAGRKLR